MDRDLEMERSSGTSGRRQVTGVDVDLEARIEELRRREPAVASLTKSHEVRLTSFGRQLDILPPLIADRRLERAHVRHADRRWYRVRREGAVAPRPDTLRAETLSSPPSVHIHFSLLPFHILSHFHSLSPAFLHYLLFYPLSSHIFFFFHPLLTIFYSLYSYLIFYFFFSNLLQHLFFHLPYTSYNFSSSVHIQSSSLILFLYLIYLFFSTLLSLSFPPHLLYLTFYSSLSPRSLFITIFLLPTTLLPELSEL